VRRQRVGAVVTCARWRGGGIRATLGSLRKPETILLSPPPLPEGVIAYL
jgi:hypothetical protein